MSEFKAIETQEELENLIKDRIKREKDIIAKQTLELEKLKATNVSLDDNVKSLSVQIEETSKKGTEFENLINDLNSKIKGHESNSAKMRIALEMGIPFELSERLSGEDEESIRKDAERLSKVIHSSAPIEPAASAEGDLEKDKDEAYKALLKNSKE